MFTASIFDSRSVRNVDLQLPGEQISRQAYPFPDHKLVILARSDGDGRTGKPVLHNRGLKERTKGATAHVEVENGFRLQTLLEHVMENGADEERTLGMRIDELRTAANFFLRCGKINGDAHKEMFNLLRSIERDLGEPKRNPQKLQAAKNVGVAINYKSSKAANPVGPVSAMAARGAIAQLERRLAGIVGIRRFVSVRHVLVTAYLRYAVWQFRLLRRFQGYHDVIVEIPAKDDVPEKKVNLHQVMRRLDFLRMQPFATPSQRILKAYEGHRYGDLSEQDCMRIIREETHIVLLIEVIERKVISLTSKSLHAGYGATVLDTKVKEIVDTLTRIEDHVRRCTSFSKSVQTLALAKLVRSRNRLAQEDLALEDEDPNTTTRKRLKKVERDLKNLVLTLPL
jgi:hypothetical protein